MFMGASIYFFRSVVLVDYYAFGSSGLLNVTVPSTITFLGQVGSSRILNEI